LVEPEQPSPDTEQEEEHLPGPSLYPIGFAIGIVVLLVGLVIDPLLISSIGAAIAIVFGFLWARDATREMRAERVVVEPERRELPDAAEGEEPGYAPPPSGPPAVTRSVFLEGSTIGLGALIGGLITVPVAGFAVLPSFLDQKEHKVDMGPIDKYAQGQWYISTFILDPAEGEVSRRTAFIRNNGFVADPTTKQQVPSFTIISNHCVHLGCPVQANGPTGDILHLPTLHEETANGKLTLDPVVPAGYGCPCHGGQYDPEGNRIAGPPVRALDRYAFEINHGRLVLLSTYSVSHVVGTGAQAKIYKYDTYGPGQHVDGPEAWFYPISPPIH
jgi:Rieske Fe-S protein